MGFFDRFTSRKGKAEKVTPKGTTKVEAANQVKKESFKAVPSADTEKKTLAAPTRQVTGDAYRVLLGAVVTEKSSRLESSRQYAFMIAPSATKKTVAEAVQKVYGIQPETVNIVNLPGKWVRYGRTAGQQMPRRKAVVTVPVGKSIDLTA